MKKINKSRYAILGMLLEEPHSGYQMRKTMMNYTTHFWQESDASIYPMLKKLEEEGKVTSKSEYVGKRERRIFEITQAGKEEFDAWFALDPEKSKPRSELLLKVYFGAHAKKEEVVKHLKGRLEKALEKKKSYKSIEEDVLAQVPDEHPHKVFWMMSLRSGKVHNAAEIRWLKESIDLLEKE